MSVTHGEVLTEVVTPVHRLAPEAKVAATLLFVLAVALVPREQVWPYAIDAALLALVAGFARARAGLLARRLVVEVPFVAFVVALPFVTAGPKVELLGLGLARDGLWTAWGILAKATLAVLATGVLSATTPAPAIVAGLERLRLPRSLTAVAGFAVRYLALVTDELRRLSAARVARGDDPRWLWQARAVGQSAGALAVRCFERGERVHGAMLARGYDGRLPGTALDAPASARAWLPALALPLLAGIVTAIAWGST